METTSNINFQKQDKTIPPYIPDEVQKIVDNLILQVGIENIESSNCLNKDEVNDKIRDIAKKTIPKPLIFDLENFTYRIDPNSDHLFKVQSKTLVKKMDTWLVKDWDYNLNTTIKVCAFAAIIFSLGTLYLGALLVCSLIDCFYKKEEYGIF